MSAPDGGSSGDQRSDRRSHAADDAAEFNQASPKRLKPAASIDQLPPELLKMILALLDCRQLHQVKTVCRAWHHSATEILEDLALRGLSKWHDQTCLTVFRRLPKSLSNVGLGLTVAHNPEMIELDTSEHQGAALDLTIVARQCRRLVRVKLQGFRLTAETLGSLARHNSRLREVELPDSCTDELLEALLTNTTSLLELRVGVCPGSSGRWMQLLPEEIRRLHVEGLEAPLENCWPQAGLRYLNNLFVHDCSGVTDVTLARLPDLAPCLTGLFLSGSRGVTAEGLQALQRFRQLMGFDMHSKPFAPVTDSMLESLYSCTLSALRLGNETEPEMHLSAEAIARLWFSRRMLDLSVHLPVEGTQNLVDRLNMGRPDCAARRGLFHGRVVRLHVPDYISSQLRESPSNSVVRVEKWKWW